MHKIPLEIIQLECKEKIIFIIRGKVAKQPLNAGELSFTQNYPYIFVITYHIINCHV